ncbi:MAG: hypothetical protein ABWX70_09905 [Hyphomicrobium sp.]
MTSRLVLFASALAASVVVGSSPGFALTTKECSVKYQAAKSGGTLNGQSWNEFRKKECAGADAATDEKPAPKVETTTATTGAVFPKSVDAKYSKESAGRARMHTCLDQYRVNKTNNGNGGLKWIQKGGGYYSLCNAALKK